VRFICQLRGAGRRVRRDVFCSGVVRSHWERFVGAINQLGSQELTRRWEQARRQIHEKRYQLQRVRRPREQARPWVFRSTSATDCGREWRTIAASLEQRAQLLNLVLAIFTARKSCFQQGLLPPELVFAHPGFLRSYHGQKTVRQLVFAFLRCRFGPLTDGNLVGHGRSHGGA